MLSDFLTKPLQGALLRKFRDVILGYTPLATLRQPLAPSPEERVGGQDENPTTDGENSLATHSHSENCSENCSENYLVTNTHSHSIGESNQLILYSK